MDSEQPFDEAEVRDSEYLVYYSRKVERFSGFFVKYRIFAIVMDLDKVKYWTELSDYDLDTADAMFRTGRWLYVGYMCHQVLEKIFKAYWSSRKEEPAPYSHNLINLAQSCGLGQLLDDGQKAFVSQMMPLNIEARYPSYKQAIGESLSAEKCQEILSKTKEVQQWVKEML